MVLSPITDTLHRPMRDLRISVIDRCNFRCPYCMPEHEFHKNYAFLKNDAWLSFGEIVRLAKIFVHFGVNKIRITGGEPLLRPNIDELIRDLSEIKASHANVDLALTTNGSLLFPYAKILHAAGLHRLTVSLDTLDEKIFKTLSGNRGDVKEILEGINAAQDAGFTSIKINAVIQRGVNDHTVLDLVEHFRSTLHVLRFIEYMDVGTCNHWDLKKVVPSKELLKIIAEKYPLEPLDANYDGEVAQRYRFKDGGGEIGFISAVSQPFCGSCTRARLSTDGKLFTCLFADSGTDLRSLIRSGASDEEIRNVIAKTWQLREDRYSELRANPDFVKSHQHKIEMFQIGG